MNTEENNKLIAEFMGGKEKKQSPLFGQSFIEIDTTNMDCYVSLPKYTNPKALRYHTSWDWLMPVVEKIENIGFTATVEDNNCSIIEHKTKRGLSSKSGSKIDAVYKAVVEFIKWYNEQKQ